jgi:hypothetical protein
VFELFTVFRSQGILREKQISVGGFLFVVFFRREIMRF